MLVLLLLASLLLVSPFYVYEVFNQETPIARLEFQVRGETQYLVRLSQGDFCRQEEFLIRGDQFQLDAGFVKWKGLAVILGFEPRYRLDRLSGRYEDVRQQKSQPIEAFDLAPDMLFDFFDEEGNSSDDNWLVDTSFGASVYQRIDPTLRYTVFATEDSLILRTTPVVDRDEGNLVITIERGCAETDSAPKSFFLGLNDLILPGA